MNLMGKIFTLLIFFMSVCFLVVAIMVGASHRNWKAAATENNQKAKQAESIAREAKNKSGEKEKLLAAERVARALQLAQLESQLKMALDNFNQKEKQLRDELVVSQERLRRLEEAEARLAQQDAEVASLKDANAKLATDIAQQFSLVRSLTNEGFELKNKISDLETMNQDLSANLAQKQKVMDANGLRDTSLTDHIVPKLDGIVTKIGGRESRDLIAIGLGTDDGLRKGHEMDVYRGDRYIGKVTVVRADFNNAVAQINKELMQDKVREGDHVTSRF
jgi:uncharacterized phage infection (PIP) family protein YhgE